MNYSKVQLLCPGQGHIMCSPPPVILQALAVISPTISPSYSVVLASEIFSWWGSRGGDLEWHIEMVSTIDMSGE